MQWKAEYYGKYAPDRDYHKPSTNVYVGALVLSHRLSSSDGDLALAVARYNSPAARRCNGYGRTVMRHYKIYRALWRDWEPPEHMRVL